MFSASGYMELSESGEAAHEQLGAVDTQGSGRYCLIDLPLKQRISFGSIYYTSLFKLQHYLVMNDLPKKNPAWNLRF